MIAKVFSSFVKGQAAMLDDRGKLIEQMSRDKYVMEVRDIAHDLLRPITDHPENGLADEFDDEAYNAESRREYAIRLFAKLCYLILGLLAILYFGAQFWRLAGILSSLFFGITNVYGSLVGLAALFVLATLAFLLFNRLELARTDTRARQGIRKIEDLLSIYDLINLAHRCPACCFSLSNLPVESDGCTLCPECNGAWNRSWWASFLLASTLGDLAHETDQRRARRCLNDARTAEFEVAAWLPRYERKAYLRLTKTKLSFRARVKLFVALVLLLFITSIPLALIPFIYWPWTVGISLIFFALSLAIFRSIYGVCQRQQFVCDQIDLRRCAQCDHELDDTPHPIDGALCCPQCRHAWDPDTTNKKHHARKRFKPNDYRHGFPESAEAPSANQPRSLASGDHEPIGGA